MFQLIHWFFIVIISTQKNDRKDHYYYQYVIIIYDKSDMLAFITVKKLLRYYDYAKFVNDMRIIIICLYSEGNFSGKVHYWPDENQILSNGKGSWHGYTNSI